MVIASAAASIIAYKTVGSPWHVSIGAVAGVLLAGLTTIPRQDWWQNSILAPRFADAALELRPYLPADWAARLDYSAAGSKPAAPGNAVEPRGQRT